MRYMARPVSFRWDESLVGRIDAARGDVPRSVFVRRAVEARLALGSQAFRYTEDGREARPAAPREAERPAVTSGNAAVRATKSGAVRVKPAPARPIVQKRASKGRL